MKISFLIWFLVPLLVMCGSKSTKKSQIKGSGNRKLKEVNKDEVRPKEVTLSSLENKPPIKNFGVESLSSGSESSGSSGSSSLTSSTESQEEENRGVVEEVKLDGVERSDLSELFSLIREGKTEEVAELIKENPRLVHLRDQKTSDMALHVACFNKRNKMISLILEAGAPLDQLSGFGYNSIYIAAATGNETAVNLLIDYDVDVTAPIQTKGKLHRRTAVHAASQYGHINILKILLDKPWFGSRLANPDVTDSLGVTPLHLAVMNGRYGATKFILKCSKSTLNQVMHVEGGGYAPIHLSIIYRRWNIYYCLSSDAKIKLDITDANGNNTLHWIMNNGGYDEVFHLFHQKRLFEPKLCPNVQNKHGQIPLHVAVRRGKLRPIIAYFKGENVPVWYSRARFHHQNKLGQDVISLAEQLWKNAKEKTKDKKERYEILHLLKEKNNTSTWTHCMNTLKAQR